MAEIIPFCTDVLNGGLINTQAHCTKWHRRDPIVDTAGLHKTVPLRFYERNVYLLGVHRVNSPKYMNNQTPKKNCAISNRSDNYKFKN